MHTHPTTPRTRLASPWLYFALAIGWSWCFWIIDIVSGLGTDTPPGLLLGLLGLIGPAVAGIACTYLSRGRAGRRDYWRRIVDVRRIGAGWWLVILLFVPALMALAAGLDLLTGGGAAPYQRAAAPFLGAPLALIPFALSIFVIGPFPEEFGWRGYALDRLQERWGALRASLTLGVIWGAWHLPLFFMRGTYQYQQGAWSQWFWLFMIGIIPLAVVITWVYNNTQRSTLAVMLFHFMVVFVDDFLNVTPRAVQFSTLLWIMAAIGVTLIWGAQTLSNPRALAAERLARPEERAA